MKFRVACLTVLAGLGLICGAESKPVNILYIMSDDHAAHAISACGGRLAKVAPRPT